MKKLTEKKFQQIVVDILCIAVAGEDPLWLEARKIREKLGGLTDEGPKLYRELYRRFCSEERWD